MSAPEIQTPRSWGRRPPPSGGGMEAVFLEHLDLVERVASSAVRRAGFPPQDVEDFVSIVKVKLIDDDYAVLRRHRGESALPTFLTAVVHNLFRDYLNHKLGKFRPSAAAKRLGPTALALERLLVRDRHDLAAAIEILRRRHAVEESPAELEDLAARLPARSPRRFVGEEALASRPSAAPESSPERRLEEGERERWSARVEEVLNLALAALSPEDLLILKMHFRDGCTVADIAAALRLKQRPLYSRRDRCFRKLRVAFEARGLTWDEVREILGWPGREIRADFGGGGEKRENGPSNTERAKPAEEERC